jgi:hypothetical protein
VYLVTLLSKLTNFKNKRFVLECPQMNIFIDSKDRKDAIKKMASELNSYFDIADIKVVDSKSFPNKTVHNIEMTVAR